MFKFMQSRLWIIPLILFVLNLVLKLLFITSNPIALDEPFTIFYAQPAFGKMLQIHLADNTPPLFDVLLFVWIKYFGIGPLSVRFLPCLFSSLTVIYVYLLGKKLGGVLCGLVSSLIFSFSSFHIYFAHEARTYSLFALLSTASLFYYFCLEEKGTRFYFMLFVASNVLLTYTHYFGVFVIGGELVLSFLFLRQFPFTFRKIWLGFLIWLAFISPLFTFALTRYHTVRKTGFWVSSPPWDAWYENIRKFSNEPMVAVGFLLVVVLGLGQLVWRKTYKNNPSLLFFPLFFFGIYFSLFFFSFFIPVFLDRYLIFLSIPFYLLVATAVTQLTDGTKANILLPVAACLSMIVTVNLKPGNQRDPIGLTAFIRSQKDSATAVFIAPPWLDKGILYYFDLAVFRDEAHFDQNMQAGRWYRGYSVDDAIKTIPKGVHRLLYVTDDTKVLESNPPVPDVNLSNFRKKETRRFGLTDGVIVFER